MRDPNWRIPNAFRRVVALIALCLTAASATPAFGAADPFTTAAAEAGVYRDRVGRDLHQIDGGADADQPPLHDLRSLPLDLRSALVRPLIGVLRHADQGIDAKARDQANSEAHIAGLALAAVGDPAVTALIGLVKDRDEFVRGEASLSLVAMDEPLPVQHLQSFETLTRDSDEYLRKQGIQLVELTDKHAAFDVLTRAVHDRSKVVSDYARDVLSSDVLMLVAASSGADRDRIVDALQTLDRTLDYPDRTAMNDLKNLPPDVKSKVVAPLVAVLKRAHSGNDEKAQNLSSRDAHLAAVALSALGAPAVSSLVGLLPHQDEFVRGEASGALENTQAVLAPSYFQNFVPLTHDVNDTIRQQGYALLSRTDSARAVDYLGNGLHDRAELVRDFVRGVLASTAATLSFSPVNGQKALNVLRQAYRDSAYKNGELLDAESSVAAILSRSATQLTSSQLAALNKTFVGDLENARLNESSLDPKASPFAMEAFARATTDIAAELRRRDWQEFFRKYTAVIVPLAIWVLVVGFLVLLLWLRPLLLLRLDRFVRAVDIKLPEWLGGLTIKLRGLVFLNALATSDRVIDAWLASVLPTARTRFEATEIALGHAFYVELPCTVDSALVPGITPSVVSAQFARVSAILINGEGGLGKTSLACEIARWVMSGAISGITALVAVVDFDLPESTDPARFLQSLRGNARSLLEDGDDLDDELFTLLLRRGRIVTIVDGISEMTKETRDTIRLGSVSLLPRRLVITSRAREPLDGIPRTTISPMRVEGNRLSTFVEAYLVQNGKKQLFDDSEYFDALRQLSGLVRQGTVTALFARLFADIMVAEKERSGSDLPTSLPDLVRRYVWELKQKTVSEISQEELASAIMQLSWLAVKERLVPMPFTPEAARNLLGSDGPAILRELEINLSLLERAGFGRDLLRFTLDPVAEYFAAEYLVAEAGDQASFDLVALPIAGRENETAVVAFRQKLRDVYDVDRGGAPYNHAGAT